MQNWVWEHYNYKVTLFPNVNNIRTMLYPVHNNEPKSTPKYSSYLEIILNFYLSACNC